MFGSDDTDRSSADSVRSRASAERQTEGLEGKRLSLMPPMMQPPPVSVGGQSPHLHQLPMEPPSLIQEKPQKTGTMYAFFVQMSELHSPDHEILV